MRHRRELARASLALAAMALAGPSLAGCGGAAVPVGTRTAAVAAIESAEVVGASEEPQASLHLELAREQLAEAEELIDRGDNERARRILERAEADAELAIALARYGTLREQAREATRHIQDMREQLLATGEPDA